MIKKLLTSLLLSTAFMSMAASAATFTVWKYSDSDDYYIQMDGDVVEGDAGRFKEAYYDQRIKARPTLFLDSSGGNAGAMHEVMKLIDAFNITTRVGDGMRCYSACAEIWLAGKKRYLNGDYELGFHVGSFDPHYLHELFVEGGMDRVQETVQLYFSVDMEHYVTEARLLQPFKFAYYVAYYGYDSYNFYRPSKWDLENYVGVDGIW